MGRAPLAGRDGRGWCPAPDAISAHPRTIDDHRPRQVADLAPGLERASSSLVAAFGRGVSKDYIAVAAATTSPWCNDQTESRITELKLVGRQMHGRGKLDLLEAHLVAPA